MLAISLTTFATGISLVGLKRHEDSLSNCSFLQAVMYGLDNLVVFNTTAYICYHVYLIVYDVEQFVKTGILAMERSISKRKIVILVVWAISSLSVLSYIIVNFIWAFCQPNNRAKVQAFAMVTRLGEAQVYLCCSIIYYVACRLISRV